MVSSQSLHGGYVTYGGLVRSSAGLARTGVTGPRGHRVGTGRLGLKGFPQRRHPVLGSALPIRFPLCQRT